MTWTAVVTAFIGSFFASLGFGVLFNIRGKLLFYAGLCGAIGGAAYQAFIALNYSDVVANFFGAVAFSLAAEIMARLLKTTVTIFTAPGLIPLVPGGTIYKMMVQMMKNSIYAGLQFGIQALAVAGALALGMMLVATLTRLWFWVKKSLEIKFHKTV